MLELTSNVRAERYCKSFLHSMSWMAFTVDDTVDDVDVDDRFLEAFLRRRRRRSSVASICHLCTNNNDKNWSSIQWARFSLNGPNGLMLQMPNGLMLQIDVQSVDTSKSFIQGRGGGQVVTVLAFYSNDPSSNPAEAYSFSVKFCFWKEQK